MKSSSGLILLSSDGARERDSFGKGMGSEWRRTEANFCTTLVHFCTTAAYF